MPLVRYEVRNQYSLAKPELYTSASKDEPDSLLDGVAVAGLVGIVRQLGDLAEFAAEIFHNLHEEIMATAARSHELVIRMQQIEGDVPSIEKALMSQTNQLRFAHTVGGEWHANIRIDQNHLTQTDLPRFIRNSYEECRGPPHLFTLDKFDVAGAGACLKRYTDPSFFKTEWASSELRRAENAQRGRNTSRLKKKIRKQRNGEIMGFPFTSQQNSRVNHSALDLVHSIGAPENLVCTSSQIVELKQQWKKVPSTGLVHKDLTNNDSPMGEVGELQSAKLNGKDIEATRMFLDSTETFVFVDGQRKRQVELGPVNDVGSEAENYVDALTTMESEIEADSECQIKREVDSDISFGHRKTGSQVPRKSYEQPAEFSIFVNVQSHDAASTDGVRNIQTSTSLEEHGKQSSSLVSLHASPRSEEKGLITDLDSGNQASMVIIYDSFRSDNNVCASNALSVEAVHEHNNVGLLSEALPAGNTKHVQIPDDVLDRSSSFAFSNSDLPSSFGHVNALADAIGKESTATLDSGKNQKMIINSVSSGCGSIIQTTDASPEAVMGDHHDAKSFTTAAFDGPLIISSFVQKPDTVLDRSSSFAFSKFESPNALLNATPSACFETADAFFQYITPELSIMYSDAKFTSPSLIEEPFAISESSAGVTDAKFQICSKIDELCNSQTPMSEDTDRTELVPLPDASDHKNNEKLGSTLLSLIPPDIGKVELAGCSDVSELASSLHDVQGEHLCNELEVDYLKHDIKGDSVCSGKNVSKHENLSSSSSEFIPVQPNIEETDMDFPIDSLQHSVELSGDLSLGSVKSGVTDSAMGADLVNNQELDVSSSEDAPRMKPAQMHEKLLDSSVTTCTTADLGEGEFPPDIQNFQMPVDGISIPPLENGEFSSYRLGDELNSQFDSSKLDGTVLENGVNTVILVKEIPEDLIWAEFTSIGCIISPCGSVSKNVCDGRPLSEFTNDDSGSCVLAESSNISCCATLPDTLLHCKSPADSTDTELSYFISNEPNTQPLAEILTGRPHAKPAASSDQILLVDHLHTEPVTKQLSAEFQRHHVGEPHEDYVKEKSASSLSNVKLQHQELLSSPQDQLNISYSQTAIRSDHNSEIISPKRSSSVSDTNGLSLFYSLPEPVIPLQKELDKKGIAYYGSSLLNDFNKSTETIIDEMQCSKLLHTVDGSECEHQRGHAQHSSASSDNSIEHATEAAVALGISTCNNQKFESSRVPLFSSSTYSLEPSKPRDLLFLKLDNGGAEAGYSRQPIQPSPRSRTSLEPEIQCGIRQQTPPPPPLPPLNWWITRDRKRSLTYTAPATPPAPPAPPRPPSKHHRPAQNSQSQKTCIERNDSLIEAIASHDKSRLRKVVRQSQSLKDKPLNEREELLHQIRTRSFNLRQTVVRKTEIPRPVTNINVSAILEKASAIRQAFVGSEDDEDDWSDT